MRSPVLITSRPVDESFYSVLRAFLAATVQGVTIMNGSGLYTSSDPEDSDFRVRQVKKKIRKAFRGLSLEPNQPSKCHVIIVPENLGNNSPIADLCNEERVYRENISLKSALYDVWRLIRPGYILRCLIKGLVFFLTVQGLFFLYDYCTSFIRRWRESERR